MGECVFQKKIDEEKVSAKRSFYFIQYLSQRQFNHFCMVQYLDVKLIKLKKSRFVMFCRKCFRTHAGEKPRALMLDLDRLS